MSGSELTYLLLLQTKSVIRRYRKGLMFTLCHSASGLIAIVYSAGSDQNILLLKILKNQDLQVRVNNFDVLFFLYVK